MQMEPQVSCNHEEFVNQDSRPNEDGNLVSASSGLSSVSSPSPAKRPTRQWAGWTHQEEESFFTALRQVGKNFEKITSRVQSKNKDQVRHYYYRLVRRMNKLLGPELSLDAKNPKDTNAAMLRWWSLLEKYSCKASKLHLKPRRFKLFLEALEHQLLKDRKKNTRKRVCQGETFSSMSLGNFSNQSRERGPDSRSFKVIFADSQNIHKFGHVKGSTNHNDGVSLSHSKEKEDMSAGKSSRQRRKTGGASSSEYRKWEKAAMAGVSLVADAAEHLERVLVDKDIDYEQGFRSRHHTGKPRSSLHAFDQNLVSKSEMHSAVKLKLQLFPLNDATRRALEMDKHNPYLELTLSNRKKISSVLEHLNRKWGSSSVAVGELMLFPYSARKENVTCHQRWTQDSFLSAADVYSMLGSPSLLRLRYGWFVRTPSGSLTSRARALASCSPGGQDIVVEDRNGHAFESVHISEPLSVEQSGKRVDSNLNLPMSIGESHDLEGPVSPMNAPWNRRETGIISSIQQSDNLDDMHLSSGNAQSAGEWADSLTNISVGDLLCDVPENIVAECVDTSQCLQQMPFSSDSFDAAIAAHILRHQSKPRVDSTSATNSSSILDDEETRDAFSFQKISVTDFPGSSSSAVAFIGDSDKEDAEPLHLVEESPDEEDPMEDCQPDTHVMDISGKPLGGLADVYWPDSLGPLDLDIRASKYNCEELILNDNSLGGLSRLIVSSLDAFQNCSLFGFDKKDQTTVVEP